MATTQYAFAGDIPAKYDQYLGPLLFEPYAADLTRRISTGGLKDLLELAAGTGIVTRHLRKAIPLEAKLVATDLSEAMLKVAKAKADFGGPVTWKVVDATELPFKANTFDYVVCQFGIMFFPDKPKAAKEVARVLRPGGRFLFNVWDSIEKNDFPRVVRDTVVPMFPEDPPAFYDVPFGYHDIGAIRNLLREAGFVDVAVERVGMACTAALAYDVAAGFVEGNPMAVEIQERLGRSPAEVTTVVEKAISDAYGFRKPLQAGMQAYVISARKPLSARKQEARPGADRIPRRNGTR